MTSFTGGNPPPVVEPRPGDESPDVTSRALKQRMDGDVLQVSVRDEGRGLPSDFNPRKAKGLGMRLVNAFMQQLDGELSVRAQTPGPEFVIRVPLQATPP